MSLKRVTMISSCLRYAAQQLVLGHHLVHSSHAVQAGALGREAAASLACRQILAEQAMYYQHGSLWQSQWPCVRHAFSSAARPAAGASPAASTASAQVRTVMVCAKTVGVQAAAQ